MEDQKSNTMKWILVGVLAVLGIFVIVFAVWVFNQPDETGTGSNGITNTLWQWESVTDRPSGETITVPDPENYTLIFRDDGTFSGQADCNNISGTYTNEVDFILTLGPSTMAACGEDSLDMQYLDLLNNVVAGGPDGAGGFVLEWAGGEKRMEFSDGGDA